MHVLLLSPNGAAVGSHGWSNVAAGDERKPWKRTPILSLARGARCPASNVRSLPRGGDVAVLGDREGYHIFLPFLPSLETPRYAIGPTPHARPTPALSPNGRKKTTE